MAKKRGLIIWGILYLVLGVVILFNSFSGLTGFVVFSGADIKWGSVLGVVFVVIGVLVLTARKEWSKLEEISKGRTSFKSLKEFSSVEDGVTITNKYEPFVVTLPNGGRGYFVKVSSKKEAANLASYLVEVGKERTEKVGRIYSDKRVKKLAGKRAASINLEKLTNFIRELISEDKHSKLRIEKIGFGRGEYETKHGRAWELEALYHDPHYDLGINYRHYGVTYSPKGMPYKREIHILIVGPKLAR